MTDSVKDAVDSPLDSDRAGQSHLLTMSPIPRPSPAPDTAPLPSLRPVSFDAGPSETPLPNSPTAPGTTPVPETAPDIPMTRLNMREVLDRFKTTGYTLGEDELDPDIIKLIGTTTSDETVRMVTEAYSKGVRQIDVRLTDDMTPAEQLRATYFAAREAASDAGVEVGAKPTLNLPVPPEPGSVEEFFEYGQTEGFSVDADMKEKVFYNARYNAIVIETDGKFERHDFTEPDGAFIEFYAQGLKAAIEHPEFHKGGMPRFHRGGMDGVMEGTEEIKDGTTENWDTFGKAVGLVATRFPVADAVLKGKELVVKTSLADNYQRAELLSPEAAEAYKALLYSEATFGIFDSSKPFQARAIPTVINNPDIQSAATPNVVSNDEITRDNAPQLTGNPMDLVTPKANAQDIPGAVLDSEKERVTEFVYKTAFDRWAEHYNVPKEIQQGLKPSSKLEDLKDIGALVGGMFSSDIPLVFPLDKSKIYDGRIDVFEARALLRDDTDALLDIVDDPQSSETTRLHAESVYNAAEHPDVDKMLDVIFHNRDQSIEVQLTPDMDAAQTTSAVLFALHDRAKELGYEPTTEVTNRAGKTDYSPDVVDDSYELGL